MANKDFQNGFITGLSIGSTNINIDAINKRDTEANLISANPILQNGEQIVVDMENGGIRIKVGDGETAFSDLPYIDESIIDRLDAIENGAVKVEVDTELNKESNNAIANSVVATEIENLASQQTQVMFIAWGEDD